MFKVGDIVRGIRGLSSRYFYINESAVMKVVKVYSEYIGVIMISVDTNPMPLEGMIFDVDPSYFELVTPGTSGKTPIERKIAFMYERFEKRNS